MQLSNLQAAVLAVIVVVVLALAGWAILDKSRGGATLLPDYVQGTRPR